jgi:uncharacterized protein (TIGR02145 family)
MLPLVGFAQTNSNVEMPIGATTTSEKQPLEIKRNAQYNLEEIKVRWKKAALENCAGAPCSAITVPGAPTGVVATVGNGSVSVAFVAPTNNGGRAITNYTVTSNPATSPVTGTSSPINVTGLTSGTTYTFTVIATNEIGNSVASSASTAVKSFTCGTTISDIDGNSYPTVLIGTQCWTQTNLKVTKYNDGTAIPDETGNVFGWHFLGTGARTVYGVFDVATTTISPLSGYVDTYGYLYNWYAATDTKKICPAGWHVPSEVEWTTLRTQNDGVLVAGGKLKSTSNLWTSQSAGTDNSSGFSALPGGDRVGPSGNIGSEAFFWGTTTNTINSSQAFRSQLPASVDGFYFANDIKIKGFSIRCLKD